MTLSVEDFLERERKGVSYCSIHACEYDLFLNSTEERGDVVYSSPSL